MRKTSPCLCSQTIGWCVSEWDLRSPTGLSFFCYSWPKWHCARHVQMHQVPCACPSLCSCARHEERSSIDLQTHGELSRANAALHFRLHAPAVFACTSSLGLLCLEHLRYNDQGHQVHLTHWCRLQEQLKMLELAANLMEPECRLKSPQCPLPIESLCLLDPSLSSKNDTWDCLLVRVLTYQLFCCLA